MSSSLTKYSPGSVKELLTLAIPMVLSALSTNLMIFVDRVMVANYSIEAMNSVAASSLTFLVFSLTAISITSISEVFVGQLNGKKMLNKLSIPVWQMIWLSLMFGVIYYFISFLFSERLVPKELHHYGLPYFKIMMHFSFLPPLVAALSGFFVGIGATRFITYSVVVGNIINLVLDYILIFGFADVIDPMGASGAAYATVASSAVQGILLFSIFLSSKYREKYTTFNLSFNSSYFKKCFKIGFPGAISHASEMCAWAVMYYFASKAGFFYLTALTIGQSALILFAFSIDGMEKGIIAVASNYIGAKKYNAVNKMLKSAFLIHVSIALIVSIPLVIFPDIYLSFFSIEDIVGFGRTEIIHALKVTLAFVLLFFLVDGMVWIFVGILTSAGDTKYFMWVNSICCWLFGTIPFYVFINKLQIFTPGYSSLFNCIYAVANLLLVFYRFRTNKWHQFKINLN